jgi:hypothetical protein
MSEEIKNEEVQRNVRYLKNEKELAAEGTKLVGKFHNAYMGNYGPTMILDTGEEDLIGVNLGSTTLKKSFWDDINSKAKVYFGDEISIEGHGVRPPAEKGKRGFQKYKTFVNGELRGSF